MDKEKRILIYMTDGHDYILSSMDGMLNDCRYYNLW